MAQEFNFENMSQEEMQMLDALRNISGRGTKGIGTSGLSGQEILTAEEMIADAPSNLETGYGPAEFNPQQRYGQRYQQRAGVGQDGPTAFDSLAANVAMGQALPYQPSYAPSFVRGPDGGGGDAGMGGFGDARDSTAFGDMSLGNRVAQDMTPASVATNIGMGFLGPGIQSGLMGAILGPTMGVSSTKGGVQGFGIGLKDAMTDVGGWASAIDSAIGAAMQQSDLAGAIDTRGVTEDDAGMASAALGMGGRYDTGFGPRSLSGLSTDQLGVAAAMSNFDPTQSAVGQLGRRALSSIGLMDDAPTDAQKAYSERQAQEYGELAGTQSMAGQLSSGGLVSNIGNDLSNSAFESMVAQKAQAAKDAYSQHQINQQIGAAFGQHGGWASGPSSFGNWGGMMDAIGGLFGGGRDDGGEGPGGNDGSGAGGATGGDKDGGRY